MRSPCADVVFRAASAIALPQIAVEKAIEAGHLRADREHRLANDVLNGAGETVCRV
jgi:hypothetical protein